MHRGVGGFRPHQAGEKCIVWVEKREKRKENGKDQAKNRKNYAKNRRGGKNRRK